MFIGRVVTTGIKGTIFFLKPRDYRACDCADQDGPGMAITLIDKVSYTQAVLISKTLK